MVVHCAKEINFDLYRNTFIFLDALDSLWKSLNGPNGPFGMDSSLDSQSIDRTFNETCCKEKGVPYECMANCKDARGPIYEGFRMGKLQSRCSKFERIIENCIIKGENKLLFAKYFKT